MQFKFILIAVFFVAIANAQQTGDSLTGQANSLLSSLTSKHSKTRSEESSTMTQTSATQATSSMTETSSMETTSSVSETGTTSAMTSAMTATPTSGAGNTISYGLPTEMVALFALFMVSFIVIMT